MKFQFQKKTKTKTRKKLLKKTYTINDRTTDFQNENRPN